MSNAATRPLPETPASTRALWQAVHWALCDGRWVDARRLLEELEQREDVVDYLNPASSYGAPAAYEAVLQDRIEMVNAVVDRNADGAD